uniref:Uncharacterized protein n=1 Tax=Timema poppense TaxID=170557 RepID=A0A7R9DIK3_TIMPO|nr:unnamed protein product [Timema poppensis]
MEEANDLMGTGRELPANPTDDPEESEVFQDLDEDHEFTPPDTFFSNLSQENSIKHSTPIKASDETSLAKMPPDDEDNLPPRDKEKHLTGERTRGQKATTQKSYTKKATTRNAPTRKVTTRKATTQKKEKQKGEKRSLAKLPDDEESDGYGSDSSDETSLSEDEGDDSPKRKRGPCPQRMKEISIPTKKEVERLTKGLPRPKYIKQSAKRIRTEMYCKKWLTKQCDDIALKLVKLGKTRKQVERSDEVRFLTECIIMNMGKLRPRPGKRSLPKVKKMRRNFAEKLAAVLLEMANNADEFAEEEEKEMRRRRKERKEKRRRKKESKSEERERSRRDEMKKENSEEERKHKSGVDEKDDSGKDDDNDDRRGSGGDHDKKSEDNQSIRQMLGGYPMFQVEHLEKADKLLKVKERGAGQEWSYGKADVIAPLEVLQWADYIHDSYSMADEWAKCLSHTVQEAENMARIKNGDIVGNDGKVNAIGTYGSRQFWGTVSCSVADPYAT